MMPAIQLCFFLVALGSVWLGLLEAAWMTRHGVAWNDPEAFPGYIQYGGGMILFLIAGLLP